MTLSSFKPCQLERHKKVSEGASRYIMLKRREGKKPLSQRTTLKRVFPARAARISDESCGHFQTFVGLLCCINLVTPDRLIVLCPWILVRNRVFAHQEGELVGGLGGRAWGCRMQRMCERASFVRQPQPNTQWTILELLVYLSWKMILMWPDVTQTRKNHWALDLCIYNIYIFPLFWWSDSHILW